MIGAPLRAEGLTTSAIVCRPAAAHAARGTITDAAHCGAHHAAFHALTGALAARVGEASEPNVSAVGKRLSARPALDLPEAVSSRALWATNAARAMLWRQPPWASPSTPARSELRLESDC